MNKRTKIVIGVVALSFVAGGAYYLFVLLQQPEYVPHGVLPMPGVPVMPPPPADGVMVVAYTDDGFSPSNTSLVKGGTVRFVNRSNNDMWVAANPHPVHSGYAGEGGCAASTFDSCGGISPGDAWEFTFDIAGTWRYHDHLNPGMQGKVTVQ